MRQELEAVWAEHLRHEFTTKNTDETLATMVADARVNHIPVATGGSGLDELREFYSRFFIPQMPPDMEMISIARTFAADRLVDEMVLRFTHSVAMEWFLPGVPPTGKRVELPIVVSVHFEGDKLHEERIYWDQASVLVQVGLLDPSGLPVLGAAAAAKVLDPRLPSNDLIAGFDRPG